MNANDSSIYDSLKLRLNFESKLKQLFLLFLVMILTLTTVSFYNVQSAYITQNKFYEFHMQDVIDFELIESLIERQYSDYESFLLSEDPFQKNPVTDEHHLISRKMSELMTRNTGTNDNFKIDQIIKAYAHLEKTINSSLAQTRQITRLSNSNKNNEITIHNAKQDVIQKIKTSKHVINQKMIDFKKTTAVKHKYHLIFQTEAAILIIAFWLGLYLYLTRSILNKQNAEKIIQNALDVSPVILFLIDLQSNHFMFVSSQVEIMLGYSHAKSQNKLLIPSKFIHPEDISSFNKFMESAAKSPLKEILQIAVRCLHKNGGYRYMEVRVSELVRNDKKIITKLIGTASDITTLKQKEAEVQAALKKLNQKQIELERSNIELEQFASIAAHDLRSPIKSIQGWSDLLDEQIPHPRAPIVAQAIEYIIRNSKKSNILIEDLLRIAKVNISENRFEVIDLNKMLAEITSVLKEEIDDSSTKMFIGILPSIIGYPSAIESVFSNLIRNAIRYRKNEGTAVIEVKCTVDGDFYKFSITDNGIGISEKYFEKIFEMFKRLHQDSEYPGTGIGLAYCKKVVNLCGGKIWVESQVNVGSKFCFTYPTSRSTAS